jgi:hypothetical protein
MHFCLRNRNKEASRQTSHPNKHVILTLSLSKGRTPHFAQSATKSTTGRDPARFPKLMKSMLAY